MANVGDIPEEGSARMQEGAGAELTEKDERIEEALRLQTSTALALLKSSNRASVCELVAERIYSIAGGALVTVSEFDPRACTVTLRSLQCTPAERQRVVAILGRDPTGLTLHFPEETRQRWIAGELAPVQGGLYELLCRHVPVPVCDLLVQELGLGDIFGMACAYEADILGSVAVVTRGEAPLRNRELIEALVAQAALALKRVRAEEAKHETEECSRLLFESTSDGAWIQTLDGVIREVNNAYCTMSGYTRGELVGMPICRIDVLETPAEIAAHIERVVRSGGYDRFESRHRRKDGSTFDVDATALYLPLDGGRVAIFTRDITERKRTEERTGRQNAVLASIAHIFREALTCETQEELGQICLAAAEDVTQSQFGFIGEVNWESGQLDDIAISNPGWELCRMQDPAGHGVRAGRAVAIRGLYGRVLLDKKGFYSNDPPSHPDSIGTPTGHPPLAAFLGVPLIHAGQTIGLVCVGNREGGYGPAELEALEALAPAIVQALLSKRAEEVLHKSEARLGLLSRTAGRLLAAEEPQTVVNKLCREVMAHLDCQAFFNFLVDPTTDRLHLHAYAGASEEAVRRIEWIDFGAAICGCVARDRERIICTNILRSFDPRAAFVRGLGIQAYCCHPLIAQGRVLGTLSFGTKTRTRFTVEDVELMRTVSDQVATAIQRIEANRALSSANAQLHEADRRKNEFLAVLSHELRNPLAPIRNSLYILDRVPPGGEKAQRAQQVIQRQVAQLSRLVDDLLDVTRITRGMTALEKQPLELNEAVGRAVEDSRSLFVRAGVHLEVALATEPICVHADSTRLAQIVGNLLQNAAKFTLAGGCTRVSVRIEGTEAAVRVEDDGIGMAPETVARLFQPFVQVDQPLDRSQGGLGLGLALVKGLVELHGGSVTAHSEGLGRGSAFAVRLPLHVEPEVEDEPPCAPARREGRRVLVIEDNVDAAESLCVALALDAHEVAVAYSGPEGLVKAREFRPEVVLCDIGLPGMDGYAVARAFCADETLKNTVLVALSGYALPADLERAAEAGFTRHLAKPPDLEQLAELLASVHS